MRLEFSLGVKGRNLLKAALDTMAGTSLNALPRNAAPLAMSSPPAVLATGRVALATSEVAALLTSHFEVSQKGKMSG